MNLTDPMIQDILRVMATRSPFDLDDIHAAAGQLDSIDATLIAVAYAIRVGSSLSAAIELAQTLGVPTLARLTELMDQRRPTPPPPGPHAA
jgi:hypothetical protein